MTRKERARIAMTGGKPDRIPVVPQICPPHAMLSAGLPYRETVIDRLRHPEKYDLLEAQCAERYGVDGFRVWLGMEPRTIDVQGADAFEVDPETGERLGIVDFNGGAGVLRLPEDRQTIQPADIEAIPVPAVDDLVTSDLLRPHRKVLERYGRKYFIIGAPGQFTVESMSHSQGMEQTLMDIIERPDIVKAWAERQLEVSIRRSMAMAELGVDALYIGETFGQFLTSEQFEDLCLPYIQRFVEALRPHGVLVYLHMCGRITHLLELIKETGVDCVEPLDEVGGTPVATVVEALGDSMALMGGVSTLLLASGAVEEVRRDCERCISIAGQNGGYIMAACDMLPSETEPEKVEAMVEAVTR